MKPHRRQQLIDEHLLTLELLKECEGLCMCCHQWPDWRGLSLSHTKPKGLGGTTHIYTKDELKLLCGSCHSRLHHLKEV